MAITRQDITDSCRDLHGDLGAFDEAARRARSEYVATLEARDKNNIGDRVAYHLMLTVDDQRHHKTESDRLGRPEPGETVVLVEKGADDGRVQRG